MTEQLDLFGPKVLTPRIVFDTLGTNFFFYNQIITHRKKLGLEIGVPFLFNFNGEGAGEDKMMTIRRDVRGELFVEAKVLKTGDVRYYG